MRTHFACGTSKHCCSRKRSCVSNQETACVKTTLRHLCCLCYRFCCQVTDPVLRLTLLGGCKFFGRKVQKFPESFEVSQMLTQEVCGRRCVISNFLDLQRVDETFSSCAERKTGCSLSECIRGAWSAIAASVRSMTCHSSGVGDSHEAQEVHGSSIHRHGDMCTEACQGSHP